MALLFYRRLAFSNLVLGRGDVLLYFYPYWQAAAEALRQGRLPLWNPNLFMGAPFLANSQVGLLYPLNWPLWLLLEPPQALKASLFLHAVLAGVGTYLAGRRWLGLQWPAAMLAGSLYAFGGYLPAQGEHINQFQALAWLPWLLAFSAGRPEGRHSHLRGGLAFALLLAVQLLAGHAQTTMISLTGLIVVSLAAGRPRPGGWGAWARWQAPLVVGALAAGALAAAQLLPTLELAAHSARQGGLPAREALSFSLHPLLLTRSLLPPYELSYFTEYSAYLPLTALLLALIGAWRWQGDRRLLALVALLLAGLFLALGAFNPLYQLLARLAPLNYFRVPARWLGLYALAAALLAGRGLDRLILERPNWRALRPTLFFGLAGLGLLAAWGWAAVPLANWLPVGSEAAVMAPQPPAVLAWGLEAALALGLLALAAGRPRRLAWPLLAGLMLLSLLSASRHLPIHEPTAPQAVTGLRPPQARLIALSTCRAEAAQCPPPGRLLSLSDIFFDVGDQAELEAVYGPQLSEHALFDYLVAVKHKEVQTPNLPLASGLHSVDGFDGGLLPLRRYSEFARLLLDGEQTADGRLREYLEAVPEDRWLDLLDVGYVITDKVGDLWRDEVYYDRQFPAELAPGAGGARAGFLPDFEATEVRLIGHGPPGEVFVETAAGDAWRLTAESMGDSEYRAAFPVSAVVAALTVQACAECARPWRIDALTLVDGRDGAFQALLLGEYRRIFSGDVKIYANLERLPRAFLVYDWRPVTDSAEALAALQLPGFDPAVTAVVEGEPPAAYGAGRGETRILSYMPERISLEVKTDRPGLLVLTDAYYPGWEAELDGAPVPIYPADVLFRALVVPAGSHTLELAYRPASVRLGMMVSALAWLAWLGLAGYTLRLKR
ncbi:MAG: YfhO family protein [Candidatus Promineifilaceae bacterium]